MTYTNQNRLARTAGFAWLVIIAAGVFAEFYVRGSLIVAGDAGATAANIRTAEGLFRLGIVGDLIMLVADISAALLLYWLLRPVNRGLAQLAALFRLLQAALIGANLHYLVDALQLLTGSGAGLSDAARQALALGALGAQSVGYDLGLVFFAFALFTLGTLFFKSRYVPRIFALLLALGGVVYLTGSLVATLAPVHVGMLEPAYLVPFFAELATALWLLVRDVNVRKRDGRTSTSSQLRTAQRA